jgi:hypothetical protein
LRPPRVDSTRGGSCLPGIGANPAIPDQKERILTAVRRLADVRAAFVATPTKCAVVVEQRATWTRARRI